MNARMPFLYFQSRSKQRTLNFAYQKLGRILQQNWKNKETLPIPNLEGVIFPISPAFEFPKLAHIDIYALTKVRHVYLHRNDKSRHCEQKDYW